MRDRIRRDILNLLKNNGHRSFRPKELAKRLDYRDNEKYALFREILEELRASGAVASANGGRVAYRPVDAALQGVLSVHPDGYGFVRVEGDDQDYFVRARRMQTAIDGDLVEIARAAPARGDRRKSAEVVRVLERKRKQAVGTLRDAGAYAVVDPDDRRLTHDIYVDRAALSEASDGDKVVASIDSFDDPRGAVHGRVLRVLGPAGDEAVQTLAVAVDQGVVIDFPDAAEMEAAEFPGVIPQSEFERRTDLRERNIFTIDPEDARDFDDALHLRTLSDGVLELGVHIADVSWFVAPGSPIDEEAFRRGTSVYLVDRAIPMLPERLSGNLCSLRPDEDRLAYSCIIELDASGTVRGHRVEETIIRSRTRFTYEAAQAVLEEDDATHPLAADLSAIADLARKLGAARRKHGSIDFGSTEVKIELDASGHPIDIHPKQRLETHRLVEECMLLANRLVAETLVRSQLEAVVSRVHEYPDRDRIAQLARYVSAFGYELKHEAGVVKPADLNRLLEQVRGKTEAPVIEQAALRAMAKARYDIRALGHFGLAFRYYTHFTSPIRRYPDLVVHRLLKDLESGRPGPDADELKHVCDHASERERVATEAERASVELKQVVYAADHVGDVFAGVVSSVSRFGVYVEINDLLVEGMVHVRDMRDDYYEYDESSFSLIGLESGRRYRPGDAVEVLLAAARVESREIDLEFTGSKAPGRERRDQRRNGRSGKTGQRAQKQRQKRRKR
jgi:ribonuclease R